MHSNDAEKCDFCESPNPDYGFDMEWDALLCWLCHLSQNFMLFFAKYRARKDILL